MEHFAKGNRTLHRISNALKSNALLHKLGPRIGSWLAVIMMYASSGVS